MNRYVLAFLSALFLSLTVSGALAVDLVSGVNCTDGAFTGITVGFVPNVSINLSGKLTISNNCTSSSSITWINPVDLSVLGPVTTGEVVVAQNSIFVDSLLRPDLDFPAHLVFNDVGFAVKPDLLRDGLLCDALTNCTNEVFNQQTQTYTVTVPGFSNYSLRGRRDFTLYADGQPELRDRVYQSIDLGDAYRSDTFKCMVQIYGKNSAGQFVLAQTNPERNVAAKLWGSPDVNNPESLGYFKTENGLANVYFNGQTLAGYMDLEYVAQCANNQTLLVYEEPVSTRYVPAGRSVEGRALWVADGSNAFYVVITIVLTVLVIWLGLKFIRSLRRR
jgi:hypothetical protein